MTNLEIWSKEMKENQANEEISVYRPCNSAEDEIRAGLVALGGDYNAAYKGCC